MLPDLSARFDLEKALSTWRHFYARHRVFLDDDLDELERHLRDHIAALQAEGLSPEAAYRTAVRALGNLVDGTDEYSKIYWRKLQYRRKLKDELRWRVSMLKNYLTIALRNFQRRKGFAFINVFGFAVGLAVCMLIALYVHDERSYEAFHENKDRTYRVLREFDLPDLHVTIASTPSALAPTIEEAIPAVEEAVRISRGSPVVQRGTQQYVESGFLVAEAGFFKVFSFPLVEGVAALERPGTIVLSVSMAEKYFPDEEPVGQTLRVGDEDLEVTGVMADVPTRSHLQFDFVTSLQVLREQEDWGRNNYLTYVLLQEGASKAEVTDQVVAAMAAQRPARQGEGEDFIPHLQPLGGIHLGQGVPVEIASTGNLLYVYLFVALALFILLLACINFMNLSTARSLDRAREVGLRKTLGAHRTQLATQFLGESLLLSALAFLIALVLCALALPALNSLAGKELAFRTLYAGPQLLLLLALVGFVGLLAGSYPALMLSRFRPTHVLKEAVAGSRGHRFRKGLVVFQFAISIALIACTAVVLNQLRYMKSAGLGFEPEHLVVIDRAGYLGGQVATFAEQVEQLAGVQRAASGFSMPGTFFINSMWQPVEPNSEAHNLDYSFVDYGYIETLGIEVVAGRSLSRARAMDSAAVMLNEAAVRDFGWTAEEAVGKRIAGGRGEFTVVGVIGDFHFRSLHAAIYPLALFSPQRPPRYVAVRIAPENTAATIQALQETWKAFSDLPFEFSFLADDLALQYETEQRLSRIFMLFSALAMLIACLGLFGLASFMAEKRRKEIGVRKVLGASVSGIVTLLSSDFLKLVAVGFVLATPVTYLAMDRWLEDFAYRVDISGWVFLLAGLAALGIALLTVSYQAVRAALVDPAKSLRYE